MPSVKQFSLSSRQSTLKAKSLPIGRSPTEMPPRPTVIFKKQKRVGGNNKSSFDGGPLESLLRSFESKKSSRKPLPSKSQNISEISAEIKGKYKNYFVFVKNIIEKLLSCPKSVECVFANFGDSSEHYTKEVNQNYCSCHSSLVCSTRKKIRDM